MRILGIDYGDKRIGVSISDPLGITAQAVGVIEKSDSFEKDMVELNKIIEKYEGVSEIVVGLPKTMRGEIGAQARKVMEFVGTLQNNFTLQVTTWDERLTTAEAEKALISAGLSRQKRRKVIDKTAATLILQSYLDAKRR